MEVFDIYRHTVIVENETPFILNNGTDTITGKQIRGMFGYIALDMTLPIKGYFINESDLRVIFKNAKLVDNENMDIRVIQYRNPDGSKSTARVVYSRHRMKFDVFSKGKNVASDIDKIITLLDRANLFMIGRGRTHGFGRFNVLEYTMCKFYVGEELERDEIRVLSKSPVFIRSNTSLQKGLASSFKKFHTWITGVRLKNLSWKIKLRKENVVILSKNYWVNLYRSWGNLMVKGLLCMIAEPVSIQYSRPIKIYRNMDVIWGLGSFVQYGYGEFKFA